ncbi:MAG: hypothetical protein ACPIOQ_44925, partial [Promethearchaeia archaeon]
MMLLRKMEDELGADAVVAHVESLPSQHLSEAVLREYLRALAAMATRRAGEGAPGVDPTHANASPAQTAAAPPGLPAGAGVLGGGGRAVHVAMSEPSVKEQVWRTLRTLAVAYLLLLG